MEKIRTLVRPVVEVHGLELVDVEYTYGAPGKILRIYIDKEGGVSIKDCADISREVESKLDDEAMPELENGPSYHLEVSSAGLDRPLKGKRDFLRFRGRHAKIQLSEPLPGGNQKNFSGVIEDVLEDEVLLREETGAVNIPLGLIRKARLEYKGEKV